MAQNNPPLTHTHTFPACLCVPAHPPERAEHRSGQRWLSPPVSLSISILCVRVSAVRVINVDDINSVKYLAAIWSVTASGSPVHVAFAPHSPQHPSKAKMCKKMKLKKKNTPGSYSHRGTTQNLERTQKKTTLYSTHGKHDEPLSAAIDRIRKEKVLLTLYPGGRMQSPRNCR